MEKRICQNCKYIYHLEKNGSWRKRKYCSPKCSQLGQKGKKVIFTQEWRDKISKAGKGRKFTKEHKRKMSLAGSGKKQPWTSKRNREATGEKSPAWRGGITPIHAAIRSSFEYEEWRVAVLERDLYTCQICFEIGGKLNVDHIKRFADYPELRLELSNGRTLCENCHRKTDTYGNKKQIKREGV